MTWSIGVSKNWSNGVLEYWSVGKAKKEPLAAFLEVFHYSITPLFIPATSP
jgi:hypothetical protein